MSNQSGMFQREKHIRYWLRCAKTFLPSQYTSGDSNRMLLAFFIVAALDLLDILESKISSDERNGWVDWIYSCQVPEGGFRGFTGTDLGELRSAENMHWDPSNLPATFFALSTLVILGDDLLRVRREECLLWLPKLQRENGSFGEVLGERDQIEGGNDLRFCCCAAGIYHILKGQDYEYAANKTTRLDAEKMVEYITSCQTYEGGFSEGPFHEAHSGLTYCAIGALCFLDRIPVKTSPSMTTDGTSISSEECIRWMLQRQTTYIEDDSSDDDEDEPEKRFVHSPRQKVTDASKHLAKEEFSASQENDSPKTPLLRPPTQEEIKVAGFNGRPNKIADTCYGWWNTGTLSMLGQDMLVDSHALRNYLLEKVQHVIGGFGKGIGEPPDILHSYLALATLSLLELPGLKKLDPTFCMSQDGVSNLQLSAWWSGEGRLKRAA